MSKFQYELYAATVEQLKAAQGLILEVEQDLIIAGVRDGVTWPDQTYAEYSLSIADRDNAREDVSQKIKEYWRVNGGRSTRL